MNIEQLKAIVRYADRIQRDRIIAGNRLACIFRQRVEEEELEVFRKSFKRVADAASVMLPSDGHLASMQKEIYETLLKAENLYRKHVEEEIIKHPLWTRFFEPIKGISPYMAAIIITHVDIHKTKYASSLWKLCGLDVINIYDEHGNLVASEGRGRKQSHMVPKKYKDENGNETETLGITFCPFLKTKLLGVVAPSMMKQRDKYKEIYDAYKNRLENHPSWKDKTKLHKHRAATRYMIKMLLVDLYKEWRAIEGLPVHPPYHETKLGIVHAA